MVYRLQVRVYGMQKQLLNNEEEKIITRWSAGDKRHILNAYNLPGTKISITKYNSWE